MLRKYDEDELGRILNDPDNQRYWIVAARKKIGRRSCQRAAADYYLDLIGEAYLLTLQQNDTEGLPVNVRLSMCHHINRVADSAAWRRMFHDRCRDASMDQESRLPVLGQEQEDSDVLVALLECVALLSASDHKLVSNYYFAESTLEDLGALLGGLSTAGAYKRKELVLNRLIQCLSGKGFSVSPPEKKNTPQFTKASSRQ